MPVKLSLATRIFLGYAVVLGTFGLVSLFSVTELHRNRLEIRLVSQGYLQLSQDAAELETFHATQEKDTERLIQEGNVEIRRAFIRLARTYNSPLMTQRLAAAQAKAHEVLASAPDSEVPFIRGLEDRFGELQVRYRDYGRAAEAVFTALATENPDREQVAVATARLRQEENAIGREIRVLRAALSNRIRERVDGAEERERTTGLFIIGFSVGATAWSARTLCPMQNLIRGVSRIGRGDYNAQLGVRGDDEVAVLAREFDQMARSLQAREAQLKAQAEALMRAEQLAAVGRISAQIVHEVRNPLSSIGLNPYQIAARARDRLVEPEEFGDIVLMLATGLMVDDAIVVIENIERLMVELRLSPIQAAREAHPRAQRPDDEAPRGREVGLLPLGGHRAGRDEGPLRPGPAQDAAVSGPHSARLPGARGPHQQERRHHRGVRRAAPGEREECHRVHSRALRADARSFSAKRVRTKRRPRPPRPTDRAAQMS
ncbi:efflux RND transporter permease subunit [Myxococcus sp. AM010]|uniref:efflux RND transporter permease subunit n=1 Tax=Myxococcus sp. AM010 TaxID=2745138 RepID=UPI0020D10AA8|nr:efflux RND transporter permease subunit [Myxococcus sp. AM010]